MTEKEVFFETRGSLGLITINRPDALNALTLNMVREIHPILKEWANDSKIKFVAIRATGDKAFCAGGDIRALYDWGRSGDTRSTGFYYEEYKLNRFIKRFPKPYIALVNGIVMGGGVGISVHGSHRIAGENFSFAMPETGIGLFPDVGGSYFLSRLPKNIGMYLALTGNRIKSSDAIFLGISQHFIESEKHGKIIDYLSEGKNPESFIQDLKLDPSVSEIEKISNEIGNLFDAESVEGILENLENHKGELATKSLDTILKKSPTSLKLAHKQITNGKNINFEECMKMEYRMVCRVMRDKDFYEGVRALIIDKDNVPKWDPKTVKEVNDDKISDFFSSLEDKELNFD